MEKESFKLSTVMLVDDNEVDNFINQKMIKKAGLANRIFVFSSSVGAFEFLRNMEQDGAELKENILPKLIFLDINMPIMDGFQFLEKFETLDSSIKNWSKIILLSSSTSKVDHTAAKKNPHVIHFLNKPLTKESIKKINL